MKKHEPKPGSKPTRPSGDAPSAEVADLQARLNLLEEESIRLRKEAEEARDKQLRARADYENLVKRSAKDSQDTIRFAKGELLLRVTGLVEALEALGRDVQATPETEAKGLQLVVDEARKLLRDQGVTEIPTQGHPFDYRVHQAVERVETSDHPDSTILGVIQRGYKLGNEVLRPALVRVAAAAHATGESASTDAKE